MSSNLFLQKKEESIHKQLSSYNLKPYLLNGSLQNRPLSILKHIFEFYSLLSPKESINIFDDNLFKLYCTKLKVEQAINQEQLKIIRINSHSKDSYVMDEEYVQLE